MSLRIGVARWALGLGLVGIGAGGCGVTVKRDLSATQPGAVTYDDMCELQEYYDALHDDSIVPPMEVAGRDLLDEQGRIKGGTVRYRYASDFQLHHLRRLLTANYGRVPEDVAKAKEVDLEVRWAEKASTKRVVTDQPAVLAVGDRSWELPYHVCLSDFLFGQQLYDTRRVVLNLPAPLPSPFSKKGGTRIASTEWSGQAKPSIPPAQAAAEAAIEAQLAAMVPAPAKPAPKPVAAAAAPALGAAPVAAAGPAPALPPPPVAQPVPALAAEPPADDSNEFGIGD